MVHKKYIERRGKRYGPYYYESYRDKYGKVKKRYFSDPPSGGFFSSRNCRVISLSIFLILFLILFLGYYFNFSNNITGKVTSEIDSEYNLGESLDGKLRFNIREGELIPQNSEVTITNGDLTKKLLLSDVSVKAELLTGNFYAENSNINGYGDGYGVLGKKIIYPEVEFELLVGKKLSNTGYGENPDDEVIIESAQTIKGKVKKGEEFVYDLQPDEEAEIILGSVKIDSEAIDEDEIKIKSKNGKAIVTSNYEEIEEGFGEEFLGDYDLTLKIDLSTFSINVTNNKIKVVLSYNGEIISSAEEELTLKENNLSTEANISLNLNQTLNESNLTVLNLNQTLNESNLTVLNLTEEANVTLLLSNFSLIKEIESVRITYGENYNITLSDYFIGAENYSFIAKNMSGDIQDGILTITPDSEFKGVSNAKVTAHMFNESLESNEFNILVSSGAVKVVTSRSKIRVGEPVRWIKNISLELPEDITVELPLTADNIVIKKISEEDGEESSAVLSSITGNVVIDIDLRKESLFVRWIKNLFKSITGRVISDFSIENQFIGEQNDAMENPTVMLNDNSSEYIIEYYTDAPSASEKVLDNGKQVVISGPDDVEYTDVIASSSLPNNILLNESQRIKLYWYNYNFNDSSLELKNVSEVDEVQIVDEGEAYSNETGLTDKGITGNSILENIEEKEYIIQDMPFDYYDIDGDERIDYIEWVVPHLSNQTFEIIYITDAMHLDRDRNILHNVFEEVRALDDIKYSIPSENYLRVTFEKNLSSNNDITLYASSDAGGVEVYEKDGAEKIADFGVIGEFGKKKIILSNLQGTQDTFDLLAVNGGVVFDYVVDPDSCTYSGSGNWAIQCNDNCTVTSNVNLLNNNFTINGTGIFTLSANISNFTTGYISGTGSGSQCSIKLINGGKFVSR